jgi:O-antigen/teichoic acid export membrane protein
MEPIGLEGMLDKQLKLFMSCIRNAKPIGLKGKIIILLHLFKKKLIYYSTPQSILNNVSAIIVIFFLNGSNNIVLTGYLLWTNKIFLSPISIISVSISQVFLKDISNLDVKKINDFTHKLVRKLFLFGLLPFSIIFFYGEEIFSFVFSENWSISGIYAQILSPWYFTVFCISPITHLAIVKNLQKQLFIIEIITTFVRVLVLIILFDRLEFVYVLSILSIIGVIYNLSILFYLKK